MYNTERFDKAAALLPDRMRNELLFLDEELRSQAEEIRLRLGRGLFVSLSEGEIKLKSSAEEADIDTVLEKATKASAHASRESIKAGYVTSEGGYRIGLCGTSVIKNGEIDSIKHISSLSIRIAKEYRCAEDWLIREIADKSTLIISPPAAGKTTLLRDIVRRLSDSGRRVSLIDERGELAAMRNGVPEFNVGQHTDIMEFCPKYESVGIVLRSMNPFYIAMDEIGGDRDIEAVNKAALCGVRLIATVHGSSAADIYKKGLTQGVFTKAVLIEVVGGKRRYRVENC
jgi:stage III sporulation protein AA